MCARIPMRRNAMCLMCDAMSRRDFLKLSALLSAGAALPLVM
ncbi:TPA: twin-arginine translocation signal domain-containing protein [Klebsiella variicola]|nr:twin-arginine translocation signal domain-containing protein [Klebsiella pneumoniae]